MQQNSGDNSINIQIGGDLIIDIPIEVKNFLFELFKENPTNTQQPTESPPIIGYHGCDESIRDKIVCQKGALLKSNNNSFSLLGKGIYFWENNYEMAYDWSKLYLEKTTSRTRQQRTSPSVIGAAINRGYCLDLLIPDYQNLFNEAHNLLRDIHKKYPIHSIRNSVALDKVDIENAAIIEMINQYNSYTNSRQFDSVRGIFPTNKEALNEQSIIQIAIRNPNCIKGFFIPRETNHKYNVI